MEDEILGLLAGNDDGPTFERARRAAEDASMAALAELRRDRIGAADARAAAREMVAFAAIRDELEHRGELLNLRPKGAAAHAA